MSNQEYKLYKIQKGDTLDRIASNLGISIDELRDFHNRYCELSDLLGGDKLPRNLSYILIPSESSFKNGIIKLELEDNKKRYKITQDSQLFVLNKPITHSIQEIEWEVLYKKGLYNHQIEIKVLKKEEKQLNSQWNPLLDLLKKLNIPFEKLELELSLEGSANKIINQNEILSKWDNIKSKLENNPDFNEVIKTGDKDYSNSLPVLRKDILFSLFFSRFYNSEKIYNQSSVIENDKPIYSVLFSGIESKADIKQIIYKKDLHNVYFNQQIINIRSKLSEIKSLYKSQFEKFTGIDADKINYSLSCTSDSILSLKYGNLISSNALFIEKVHEKLYYTSNIKIEEIV